MLCAERRGQLGPGGLIETYISGMWAILLGCILWEAHCNNQEGRSRDPEREKEKGEGYRIALSQCISKP